MMKDCPFCAQSAITRCLKQVTSSQIIKKKGKLLKSLPCVIDPCLGHLEIGVGSITELVLCSPRVFALAPTCLTLMERLFASRQAS